MSWTTVLTDPEEFFAERADDPALRGPALVVLVVGVLGLLSAVPVLLLVLRGVPSGARAIVGAGLAIGAVFGLVGPFVVWLLYAIVFYAISIAFDGTGTFRELFALTGWGFLPRVLGAAISAVVLFVAIGSVGTPESAEAMRQFGQQLRTSPLVRASTVVGIAITLWSAYVWTHAVAAARDLSVRAAAVTVGIPVLVSIVWSVLGLFGVRLF